MFKDVTHFLPAFWFCERTTNPITTTPMRSKITRQMQTNATVNSLKLVVDVTGWTPDVEEVGIGYGVGVTASGAPETGT
jgi:hypothetical protein